jgi:hypothetical protein
MRTRIGRRALVAGALTVACLLVLAVPAGATAWVAENISLTGLQPAAGAAPGAFFQGVSCPADGSCVAVGSYADDNGDRQGLIETLSGGQLTATTAPLAGLSPAAAGNPQVALFDVRCPVAGWCLADGQYVDVSGKTDLLAEVLDNGSWSATTLPLTGLNPAPDPSTVRAGLSSMSCPAQGACVLVGAYADSSFSNQPLTEQLAGGVWTSQTAPIDTLSPAATTGQLFDVSCPSAGVCTAVGDTDGAEGDLVETLSSGTWTPSSPSLAGLTPTATPRSGALTNVSCPSTGACTEVGTYEDQTLSTQGLIVTGASQNTTAVDLTNIKPPADSNPLFGFDGLACFATCIAVGGYTSSGGSGRPPTITTIGGAGGPTTTVASLSGLNPSAASPPALTLQRMSCASVSSCVAVGQYPDSSGDIRAIVETITGATSSAATPDMSALTPAPASDPGTVLSEVSCPPSGACMATGSYLDASSTSHAMLVVPPAPAPRSVSVSLSPATITADGQATTTATATVTAGGSPVSGDTVSFVSSDAGQTIGPVADDGGGKYTATITASETVGAATITATDESDPARPSGHSTLTEDPPKIQVSVAPSSIPADGKSTATATVTLTGVHGEPVSGQTVSITTSGPASAGLVGAGAGGTYTAAITASDTAGTVTVTGSDLSVEPNVSGHATLKTKAVSSKVPPPKHKHRCVVPKLHGDSLAAAKRALRKAHCSLGKVTRRKSGAVAKGHVISSKPGHGTHHRGGLRIAIVLSRGKD